MSLHAMASCLALLPAAETADFTSGRACQWRFIVEGDGADCKACCTTETA